MNNETIRLSENLITQYQILKEKILLEMAELKKQIDVSDFALKEEPKKELFNTQGNIKHDASQEDQKAVGEYIVRRVAVMQYKQNRIEMHRVKEMELREVNEKLEKAQCIFETAYSKQLNTLSKNKYR